MDATLLTFCPLCKTAAERNELFAHINSEYPRFRAQVISVIEAYRPGWSAERGVCDNCWRTYRGLTRVINALRTSSPALLRRQ